MTVCEKTKMIDNKIVKNKAQYSFDWPTPLLKILILLPVNISKNEFLISQGVLLEEYLSGKAATV